MLCTVTVLPSKASAPRIKFHTPNDPHLVSTPESLRTHFILFLSVFCIEDTDFGPQQDETRLVALFYLIQFCCLFCSFQLYHSPFPCKSGKMPCKLGMVSYKVNYCSLQEKKKKRKKCSLKKIQAQHYVLC